MMWKSLVLSGLLVVSSAAQTKNVPDAQVESNVLKELASEAALQNQNIETSVAFGTVTLHGSVTDEKARIAAEQAAARAAGVKKVVDELTIGASTPLTADESAGAAALDEAQNEANNPQMAGNDQTQNDPSLQQQQPQDPQAYPQPPPPQGQAYPQPQQGQAPYPPSRAPYQRRVYGPYAYPGGPPVQGRAPYPPQQGYQQQPATGGQQAGRQVTVAPGSVIQIRINQPLYSRDIQPGATFDGTVVADLLADGAIAIPRGATVHGQVVDAQGAGAIKGRGSITLQLTAVSLGGQQYPLTSELWVQNGRDKSVQSVNSTLGGGVVGAIIGGVVGGGPGAAVGAAVGGAAGLGASAGSQGGNVLVPAEAVLQFRLAEPATVATVGQDELNRLAYNSGPQYAAPTLQLRYPYPYAAPYAYPVVVAPGPFFYGGYYRPWGYGYRRGYWRY